MPRKARTGGVRGGTSSAPCQPLEFVPYVTVAHPMHPCRSRFRIHAEPVADDNAQPLSPGTTRSSESGPSRVAAAQPANLAAGRRVIRVTSQRLPRKGSAMFTTKLLRAALAAVCLLSGVAVADAAAAPGDLVQKPGAAGCLSIIGFCDRGPRSTALSP
jgi:hypothetical protein